MSPSPPESVSSAWQESQSRDQKKRSTRIDKLKIPIGKRTQREILDEESSANIVLRLETYNPISVKTKTVKISKLCLALVELVKVCLFKSYPRMSLINLQ